MESRTIFAGVMPSTVMLAFFRELAVLSREISTSRSLPAASLMVPPPTLKGLVAWVINSSSAFSKEVSPDETV